MAVFLFWVHFFNGCFGDDGRGIWNIDNDDDDDDDNNDDSDEIFTCLHLFGLIW